MIARRRRVPRTTDSRHDHPVLPTCSAGTSPPTSPTPSGSRLLVHPDRRGLAVLGRDQGWTAARSRATREIVGWSMADHLKAKLVCAALLMAIRGRRPPRGLVHHSNSRGVQYASEAFQKDLARAGMVCSMRRRGNSLDSAPAESFFHTLKTELVHHLPTPPATRPGGTCSPSSKDFTTAGGCTPGSATNRPPRWSACAHDPVHFSDGGSDPASLGDRRARRAGCSQFRYLVNLGAGRWARPSRSAAGRDLPEAFATLRRLLEIHMGKAGKRE